MKLFILMLLTIVSATGVSAQKTFLLKNASKNYDVKIAVAACKDDICEGRASVSLIKKSDSTLYQKIEMPNLYLELGAEKKPTANLIELYGENNSGVVFDDFNFDGLEDLALRNGNDGAYGGPSYDVFLTVVPSKKFVRNAALTRLASKNLGLFEVDKEKKTIETFNKDGCCWHQTTRYKVVNNRPIKVYVLTEDAADGSGKVKLTTENLVAGKWKKTFKTALVKDYYKDQ